MRTMLELKDEIDRIATEGQQAALRRDLVTCIKCGKQVEPLLRELAERSGNDSWNEIADSGQKLISETEESIKQMGA